MRNTTQISAVIPTYNRAHLIGRAIESVLGQRYAPTEVIVIDDGSTDRTRQVVESYDARVRYVFQSNSGVSTARNRGVKEARFEWIAFLDSDDCWLPDHLGRIVNAIEATRGDAALYFSDTQQPTEDGGRRFWHLCGLEIAGEFEFRPDAGEWAIAPVQPMMIQASVIRRMTYLEVGGLAEQLRTREDTHLFYKLALQYPACAVSGCGTVMNSNDNIRLTQEYDTESLVYRNASIFLYKDLLGSVSNISRKYRQFLTDSLCRSYFCSGRVFFRRKKYFSAIRSFCISCVTSPAKFTKELLGSLGRHLVKGNPGSSSSSVRSGAKV
jgi:glycosyltransferase involved in cell wall biosynthesis